MMPCGDTIVNDNHDYNDDADDRDDDDNGAHDDDDHKKADKNWNIIMESSYR